MKRSFSSKERHRLTLLEYLGNPENKWPRRQELSTQVLGFKQPNQIYKAFSLNEIYEIELEALEIRRQKYIRYLSMVDSGLLKRAAEGDPRAAKLAYQKFENWSVKTQHEVFGKNGGLIKLSTLEQATRISSLLALAKKRLAEEAGDSG